MRNAMIIKRFLAALCLLAVLTAALSGCMDIPEDGGNKKTPAQGAPSGTGEAYETGETDEPYESEETLSEEQIRELEDAGFKKDGHFFRPFNGTNFVGNEKYDRYYGMFNGCTVFGVEGMLQAIWKIKVAGKTFTYNCSYEIYVCRDNKTWTLSKAYENGVLTDADINEIYKAHSKLPGAALIGEDTEPNFSLK